MGERKAERRAPRPPKGASKQLQQQDGGMDSYLDQLRFKARGIPQTPAIKRFKVSCLVLKLLSHVTFTSHLAPPPPDI